MEGDFSSQFSTELSILSVTDFLLRRLDNATDSFSGILLPLLISLLESHSQ